LKQWGRAALVVAAPLLLGGCGKQSPLSPKSPSSHDIAVLWWWMLGVAAIVFFGAVALLVIGGLTYTAGALVYARRRPDPVHAVFGYHELFHALTIVAVSCQYVAIALIVA